MDNIMMNTYKGVEASTGKGAGVLYYIVSFESNGPLEILGPNGLEKRDLTYSDTPEVPFIIAAKHSSPILTSWLLTAEGLVLEMGGVLSHTAYICRELGIPCIGSINRDILKNFAGKLVQVDGYNAKINLLK